MTTSSGPAADVQNVPQTVQQHPVVEASVAVVVAVQGVVQQQYQREDSPSLSESLLWGQVSAPDEGSTSRFHLPELASRPPTPEDDLLAAWVASYLAAKQQLDVPDAPAAEPSVEPTFVDAPVVADAVSSFDAVWNGSIVPNASFDVMTFPPPMPLLQQRWPQCGTQWQAPQGAPDLSKSSSVVASHDAMGTQQHQHRHPDRHSPGAPRLSWPALFPTTQPFSQGVAPLSVPVRNSLGLALHAARSVSPFPAPPQGMAEHGRGLFPTLAPASRRQLFQSFGAHYARHSAAAAATPPASHHFEHQFGHQFHDHHHRSRTDHLHAANAFHHLGSHTTFHGLYKPVSTATHTPVAFSTPNANVAAAMRSSVAAARPPQQSMVPLSGARGSWSTVQYVDPRHGANRLLPPAPPPPLLNNSFDGSVPHRHPRGERQSWKHGPYYLSGPGESSNGPSRQPPTRAIVDHGGPSRQPPTRAAERLLPPAPPPPLPNNSFGSVSHRHPSAEPQSWKHGPYNLSGLGESSSGPSRQPPTRAVVDHGGAAAALRNSTGLLATPAKAALLAYGGPALNTDGKPRALRGSATDPQSMYARSKRERVSERVKILQSLIPNASKVDTVTMLDEALNYVKFLEHQVELLKSDKNWKFATPTIYKGIDLSKP